MDEMRRYDPTVSGASAATVGAQAPEFILTSLDGVSLQLAQLRGRVVVLDLMAMWCETCLGELEHLRGLRMEAYGGSCEVVVVDVDDRESGVALDAFRKAGRYPFHFAIDTDQLLEKFGVQFVPTVLVIDPQGVIRFRSANVSVPLESLALLIDALLEGTTAAAVPRGHRRGKA